MGSGGARQSQTTPPTAMDLFNARAVSDIAPLLFNQIAQGASGISTAEKAGGKAQSVAKGVAGASQQQLAPGTSQMFSMIDAMGQPGSAKKTADMMLLMYGKQPQMEAMGGSQVTSPGLMDYTNTASNIAGLYEKYKKGQQLDTTPTIQYSPGGGAYGGQYNTGYNQYPTYDFGGK